MKTNYVVIIRQKQFEIDTVITSTSKIYKFWRNNCFEGYDIPIFYF